MWFWFWWDQVYGLWNLRYHYLWLQRNLMDHVLCFRELILFLFCLLKLYNILHLCHHNGMYRNMELKLYGWRRCQCIGVVGVEGLARFGKGVSKMARISSCLSNSLLFLLFLDFWRKEPSKHWYPIWDRLLEGHQYHRNHCFLYRF